MPWFTDLSSKTGKFDAHLLGDDDQRVSVLGQEVEDAPDLEGVVVGDD